MPEPTTPPNKWIVAVSITFGTLMGAIDGSIVNVALPHIRGSVGATVEEITAISTAYIIASVVIMPLTGFLGRMFGQKRVYMFCLALFLVGSALCGAATSLPMLVLFRAVQGFGAGALQPTEQAILRQTFSKEEQGTAMALFAMAVMIGPAIGPTLGGWITDNYSWPWIFYINVPVGILGLFLVWNFVYEPPDILEANRKAAPEIRKHIDWPGIGLLWAGLAALQYALEEGSKNDWFESPMITGLVAFSVISLALMVVRELTTPYPVINLAVFKDPGFASGTAIGAVMFGMLMGSMFLLPVFMQELLGFTATDSGLTLMPRTLVMMVATPIVGRLYNKVPPAIIIAVGICFFAIGSYQLSHLTLEAGSADVIGSLITTGIGFSCLFVPLSTASLTNIPREQLTDATGINSLFRQIGGSLGLTAFATLEAHYFKDAHANLLGKVDAFSPAAVQRMAGLQAAMMARGMDAVSAQAAATKMMLGNLFRQAEVLAFEKTFMLQGLSFMAVIPLLYFLKVDRNATPVKVDMHE